MLSDLNHELSVDSVMNAADVSKLPQLSPTEQLVIHHLRSDMWASLKLTAETDGHFSLCEEVTEAGGGAVGYLCCSRTQYGQYTVTDMCVKSPDGKPVTPRKFSTSRSPWRRAIKTVANNVTLETLLPVTLVPTVSSALSGGTNFLASPLKDGVVQNHQGRMSQSTAELYVKVAIARYSQPDCDGESSIFPNRKPRQQRQQRQQRQRQRQPEGSVSDSVSDYQGGNKRSRCAAACAAAAAGKAKGRGMGMGSGYKRTAASAAAAPAPSSTQAAGEPEPGRFCFFFLSAAAADQCAVRIFLHRR